MRKFLLLPFLLVIAHPLAAQQPEALSQGKKSIEFTPLFLNGQQAAQFGLWKFKNDRVNRGINISAGYTHSDVDAPANVNVVVDNIWNLRAGPAWKHYFSPARHVAPYRRLDVNANYERHSQGERMYGADATFGLGVDWFPTADLSIGGYTGVTGSFSHSRSVNDIKSNRWDIGTMRSSVGLNIYF